MLMGEYARLYLVVTLLPERGKVVLERMVLVIGPSHTQRSSASASFARTIVGEMHQVLDKLKRTYAYFPPNLQTGALCFRQSADNGDVVGLLDAIVFTDFETELSRNNGTAVLRLLFHGDWSLFSYFKRRRVAPGGRWMPRTVVYCAWDEVPFSGDGAVTITHASSNDRSYMEAKWNENGVTCRFARLRHRGPKHQYGHLTGLNVFNVSDADQNAIKWENMDKSFSDSVTGLNVEEFSNEYSPRLYILTDTTVISTFLLHNLNPDRDDKICLQYNADHTNAWDPILLTMGFFNLLELVSLHWGHTNIPFIPGFDLEEIFMQTIGTTRFRINWAFMQLIPKFEEPQGPNLAQYCKSSGGVVMSTSARPRDLTCETAPKALVLASDLQQRRDQYTLWANSYPAALITPKDDPYDDLYDRFMPLWPLIFDEEWGFRSDFFAQLINAEQGCFTKTIRAVEDFHPLGTVLPSDLLSRLDRYLVREPDDAKLSKEDFKSLCEGLATYCVRAWTDTRQGLPLLPTAVEAYTSAPSWLHLSAYGSVAGVGLESLQKSLWATSKGLAEGVAQTRSATLASKPVTRMLSGTTMNTGAGTRFQAQARADGKFGVLTAAQGDEGAEGKSVLVVLAPCRSHPWHTTITPS
jgi:hypothetical protein